MTDDELDIGALAARQQEYVQGPLNISGADVKRSVNRGTRSVAMYNHGLSKLPYHDTRSVLRAL